jgi:hypothetical protein
MIPSCDLFFDLGQRRVKCKVDDQQIRGRLTRSVNRSVLSKNTLILAVYVANLDSGNTCLKWFQWRSIAINNKSVKLMGVYKVKLTWAIPWCES